ASQNVPGFVEGAQVGIELPSSKWASLLFTRSFRRFSTIGWRSVTLIRRSVADTASFDDEAAAFTYTSHLLSGLQAGKKLLSALPVLCTMMSGAPQAPSL